MNFLTDIHNKKVAETERNLFFWEDYLKNLKAIDFSAYSDKLTVPTLVPIGSRIFFRGELKHTNEVTVSLGADYFVKCSLKQAEVLRQRRINDAQSKVDMYKKEKEYLQNQISFSKENIYGPQGQEIIEVFTAEEDKAWRETHRENMKRYKQKKAKEERVDEQITDEELWNKLEELELQEELENELLGINNILDHKENEDCFFVIKENATTSNPITASVTTLDKEQTAEDSEKQRKISFADTNKTTVQTPKQDLLQQVIERQNELEHKLLELKNREKSKSKTKSDLISKLDEMEQLEELEDEMDRLDDILDTEDIQDTEENNWQSQDTKVKRHVSFADQDDGETLEITFKHSDVEPDNTHYNAEKGIQKPSDVYQAYTSLFGGAISILKKTKYDTDRTPEVIKNTKVAIQPGPKLANINNTIVISDVIEKVDQNDNKLENDSRPISLFKKRRIQNKS